MKIAHEFCCSVDEFFAVCLYGDWIIYLKYLLSLYIKCKYLEIKIEMRQICFNNLNRQ